jgi:hypothetical protein
MGGLVELIDILKRRGVFDLEIGLVEGNKYGAVIVYKNWRMYRDMAHRLVYSDFVAVHRTSRKCFRVLCENIHKGFRKAVEAADCIENILRNHFARKAFYNDNPHFLTQGVMYKEQDFTRGIKKNV